MHKKGTKNAKKSHKKCKKNAIKKQNKCDQKRSGLCLCILFCFVFEFLFSDFVLHFLSVSLRKRKQLAKQSHKKRTTNEPKCKKIAHKTHKHRNTSHKKRWCVKFGCACAFFVRFVRFCFTFCLLFVLVSFCNFFAFFIRTLFDQLPFSCLFHACFLHFLVIISECGFAFFCPFMNP